jgi:hypothetical protein
MLPPNQPAPQESTVNNKKIKLFQEKDKLKPIKKLRVKEYQAVEISVIIQLFFSSNTQNGIQARTHFRVQKLARGNITTFEAHCRARFCSR